MYNIPHAAEIFSSLWLIRTIKFVLFWLYVWQLKEYHIPRFIDHFRTDKGKRIFFSTLPLLKLVLLVLLVSGLYFNVIFSLVLLIYAAESLAFFAALARGRYKRPVFTSKASLLAAAGILLTGLYGYLAYRLPMSLFWLVLLLLLWDIALPLAVSLLVLLFQPFTVMVRHRILAKAQKKIASRPDLITIGITGSYGKTSTKEFISTLLDDGYRVLSTKLHQNSEMGIARCILRDLEPRHQVFVVEMGAYRKGGISLLCDMVKPKIGVVTGVNEQHLALFGSLENLLSAEGGRELLAHLPADGTLIVNGDNPYCLELYKKAGIRKRIYSAAKTRVDADMWASEVSAGKDTLSFVAHSREKEAVHAGANVLGAHNAQNLLAAMLAARELGMGMEAISRACEKIRAPQAGMTRSKGAYGIEVVDSSYSANPDGVAADLEYLKAFNGKRAIVMPCLIELGGTSSAIHRQLGKKIAEACDMAIITTADKFEEIKSGAAEHGLASDKILFIEDAKEVFAMLTTFLGAGDVVLLEGRVPAGLLQLLTDTK